MLEEKEESYQSAFPFPQQSNSVDLKSYYDKESLSRLFKEQVPSSNSSN